MWTPANALRNWVRRQVKEQFAGYFDELRSRAEAEIRAYVQAWPGDACLLGQGTVKGQLDQKHIILDHNFEKPVVLGGYVDATNYIEGDRCKIAVYVQFEGKEDLTPLYGDNYAGVMEDCIALHEQPVVGRVQVVYTHQMGTPKKVFYRFFSRT